MEPPWFQYFDHAADVGIRVGAASLSALFETAGRALMEWIGLPQARAAEVRHRVEIEAEGVDELLVRWLQEILFLFHARRAYFLRSEHFHCTERRVSAELVLFRWDEADSGSYQEVKAVTYHQLSVTRSDRGWQASFILDI